MVVKVLLSETIKRLQVQTPLLVNKKEYLLLLNSCTRSCLTELDQSTPNGLNKGFISSFCVGSRIRHENKIVFWAHCHEVIVYELVSLIICEFILWGNEAEGQGQ